MFRILQLVATAVGLVALLLGGLVAYCSLDRAISERKSERIEHLNDTAHRFLKRIPFSNMAEPSGDAVKAKPIFLCITDNNNESFGARRYRNSIDPLTAELPKELFPASDAEVGSVVALFWGQVSKGVYRGDYGQIIGHGYQESCRVEVYDTTTFTLLHRENFLGGEPPSEISENAVGRETFGLSCSKDVVKYVVSLFAKRDSRKF